MEEAEWIKGREDGEDPYFTPEEVRRSPKEREREPRGPPMGEHCRQRNSHARGPEAGAALGPSEQ